MRRDARLELVPWAERTVEEEQRIAREAARGSLGDRASASSHPGLRAA
jgi:hypothetical protein